MDGRLALPRIVAGFVLLLSACSTTSAPPPDAATASNKPSSSTPSPSTPSTSTPPASYAGPTEHTGEPRADSASVSPIGPALRDRMRHSHSRGCPVRWRDLRYLRMRFVGFDAKTHLGEMVVHKEHADAVTRVFEQLYDARWPIQRMRLVDDYQGDDDRSMAANNTSGYNCRRVSGSDSWSAHAYGAAIDINPVQNPYVNGTSIEPPSGRQFAAIDRSARARTPAGAIQSRRHRRRCVHPHRLGLGRRVVDVEGLPTLLGHRRVTDGSQRLTPAADRSTLWPSTNAAQGRASWLSQSSPGSARSRVSRRMPRTRTRSRSCRGRGACPSPARWATGEAAAKAGRAPGLQLHPLRRQGVAGLDDGLRYG